LRHCPVRGKMMDGRRRALRALPFGRMPRRHLCTGMSEAFDGKEDWRSGHGVS
jgi:hypothetical protein